MQIIQQKIRKTGNNSNLIIPIGSKLNQLGYQQEIDSRMQIQSQDSINSISDYETRKFKLDFEYSSGGYTFYFQFKLGSNFSVYYTNAGFTSTEITEHAKSFDNSFFILDFYDTYDPKIQQKIFTIYQTKLGTASVFNIHTDVADNQLYYCYVPNWFIERQTGDEIDVYFKLMFYNAKSGNIRIFYNLNNEALTTPEKYYFKVHLDLVNRKWYPYDRNVIAHENNINQEYIDRLKNTLDKNTELQQDYPGGDFYYGDATYQ